ncbi:MAG: carbonic anhydrase [Acidobacteriota bacterium]
MQIRNVAALVCFIGLCSASRGTPALLAQTAAGSEPKTDSLQRLMEGNRRYAAGRASHPNGTIGRRAELANMQQPFAVVFGCVDSRVPPELILDQGLGDLLVIRSAGEVLDGAVLASLEFGVELLKSPLLVVMGHERCGAVGGTIDVLNRNATLPGQLKLLVEGIRPAVEKARGSAGDLVDQTVRAQVELTVQRLRKSPLLAEHISRGALRIVGIRYDLDTGLIEVTVPE